VHAGRKVACSIKNRTAEQRPARAGSPVVVRNLQGFQGACFILFYFLAVFSFVFQNFWKQNLDI
jgi:hypothetical protein